ncbi:GTPase ObgE [bacterium]|nr:GTPase ObgE [bacterium]
MFVDRAEIFVRGGDGGNGCMSFRREKFVPKGGPDGGDGGAGGSVIIRAVANANSLAGLSFRRHWEAPRGEGGQGKLCTGKSGDDLLIEVPLGTIIKDRERQFVIKDLSATGEEVVIARGGKGGRGNSHFATSTHQAPREFEEGQPGEQRWIVLELKVIADVGLVGLPNAGKSTLLSRITHATPEIADYPFTTKYPNLGICFMDSERTCVVADIPGLIEGAHEGIGLGHEFLRHVERTKILVHLIDAHPIDESSPLDNYRTIRNELEQYSVELPKKPEIIVLSKADVGDSTAVKKELESALGKEVLVISAVSGTGMKPFLFRLAKEIDDVQRALPDQVPKVLPPHRREENLT